MHALAPDPYFVHITHITTQARANQLLNDYEVSQNLVPAKLPPNAARKLEKVDLLGNDGSTLTAYIHRQYPGRSAFLVTSAPDGSTRTWRELLTPHQVQRLRQDFFNARSWENVQQPIEIFEGTYTSVYLDSRWFDGDRYHYEAWLKPGTREIYVSRKGPDGERGRWLQKSFQRTH